MTRLVTLANVKTDPELKGTEKQRWNFSFVDFYEVSSWDKCAIVWVKCSSKWDK